MPPRKQAAAPDPAKKLKVQVGACKRYKREMECYVEEVAANEAKVQKMRDDERDEYDIRKQEEVLGESIQMVPHSRTQFEQSILTLQELLEELKEEEGLDATIMEEAQALVAQNS